MGCPGRAADKARLDCSKPMQPEGARARDLCRAIGEFWRRAGRSGAYFCTCSIA
jgi:hypothetical protein